MTGPRLLRILLVVLLAVAFLPASPAHPAQAVTPLPTNVLVFDSNRTGNYEIYRMNTDGSNVQLLTYAPGYDTWWPRISPDRASIIFYRTPAGVHDTDTTKNTLWIMSADGTNQTMLLGVGAYGWVQHGHAEWSPNGQNLVMFGGPNIFSPQIYITTWAGANPVRVTSNGSGGDRPGVNIDPSWNPDGGSVLFVGCNVFVNPCNPVNYEIFRISVFGTLETQLTSDNFRDQDPYYSPNGAAIAWIRQTGTTRWGLFRMTNSGAGQAAVIDDGWINGTARWSLDSAKLYFHRAYYGLTVFNTYWIYWDGTGLTQINPGAPGVNEYPAN